jgi:HemX protein
MLEAVWIYEIILVIYGLSLIGYFIDFIQHNRKANKTAFWLLGIVWLLQTAILIDQIFYEKNFPVLTLSDGLFFYAWVLITFSLVINRTFTVYFIVFFLNVFSFFILLLYLLTSAQKHVYGSGVQFVHEILITHITLAILSYGFFTLSFVFSIMYLMQYLFLKNKKALKWIWRFADLKKLDDYSFKTITLGVPLMLIGLILGLVWANVAGVEAYWLDPKTVGSIFVLAVYIVYLFLRVGKGLQGKIIALYNTCAFLILLINFFLFGVLSNFHF